MAAAAAVARSAARAGRGGLVVAGRPRAAAARAGGARARPRAAGAEAGASAAAEGGPKEEEHGELKALLEDLKQLGRVRLIVNTGAFVLESCTTFDELSYGRGYANLMTPSDNVDFHLKLELVSSARFERKKAPEKLGGYDMMFVRFSDADAREQLSVFVMWPDGAQRGEYAPGQEEAFTALESKWGERTQFQLCEAGFY